MNKLKEFLADAEVELTAEALNNMEDCPLNCQYLDLTAESAICPCEANCTNQVETACPRVTEEKVLARAEDNLEAYVNQKEETDG